MNHSTDIPQAFDRLCTEVARSYHLNALAVGMCYQGNFFSYHQGRTAHGPVDSETVFPIGSASKAFIATSILQLCDKRILDLDERVIEYLPSFELSSHQRTQELTIRDLLCHRSGLPRHDITLFTNQDTPLKQMVHNIRYLEPAWPARQRFCYQNHLFAAASLLVEEVTGMPWGDYVGENIFSPLHMNRSYTKSQQYESVDNNFAKPKMGLGPFNLPTKNLPCDSTGAAGAISSCLQDMMAWISANLEGGYYKGSHIFSSTSAAELHQGQMPIHEGEMMAYELDEVTESAYGLGWFIDRYRNHTLVHHGGTITGFKSLVGFMPEDGLGFVVLTNRNNTQASTALGYLLCDLALGHENTDWIDRFKVIEQEKATKGKVTYRSLKKGAPPKNPPRSAAGTYHHPAYGNVVIENKGNHLQLTLAGFKLTIRPGAQSDFIIDAGLMGKAFPCFFSTEDNGRSAFHAKLEDDLDSYICFEKTETKGS